MCMCVNMMIMWSAKKYKHEMCDTGLICPVSASLDVAANVRAMGSRASWHGRARAEEMAGDTADRPARQEIHARRDTDHSHLHLLMTLSFWLLSLCHRSMCKVLGWYMEAAIIVNLWEHIHPVIFRTPLCLCRMKSKNYSYEPFDLRLTSWINAKSFPQVVWDWSPLLDLWLLT